MSHELPTDQIQGIDEALLAATDSRWRKVTSASAAPLPCREASISATGSNVLRAV